MDSWILVEEYLEKHAIVKSGPDLIYLYGKDNVWWYCKEEERWTP